MPWLTVRNGAAAVEFYQAALGAVPVFRLEGAGGSVVARLSIGGYEFWLSDEAPEHGNFNPQSLGGTTVRLILTVTDPNAVFASAVSAGAKEDAPVTEAHGWRSGRIPDPFGHSWEIGRPLAG